MINSLKEMTDKVREMEQKTVAIVCADEKILDVVTLCIREGIAQFILIGKEADIEPAVNDLGLDVEIIDENDAAKAATLAVELVHAGKADVIMKGLLHTSTFIKAILDKEKGFHLGKRMSAVAIIDKVYGEGLQLITDCALAIKPTLSEKKEIIENAVYLAKRLGYVKPKVAVISALEEVNPEMEDTLDAAVLSKMGDRGQIKDAIIDGPLALDNAINKDAARHKGIRGQVAGDADILIVPNLLVGNVLGKSLFYYAKMDVATAIVGAGVPVVMTSRTDLMKNKMLSVAISVLMA